MKTILHKIVAIPAVYDVCQWMAGASTSRRVFLEEYASLPSTGSALDVGGGTGSSRSLLPEKWSYCCLDPDPQKLEGFRAKFPLDEWVQASACSIPAPGETYDAVLMNGVSHHLADEEFENAVSEVSRVLKTGGTFFYMDSLWNPRNVRCRFLYRVDRGSYPRTEEAITSFLAKKFRLKKRRHWKVHHEYILLACGK